MSGGYRAYLRNIFPRLAAHSGVEAILCASPAQLKIASWFPDLRKVSFVSCSPFRFMRHRPDAFLKRTVEQFSPDVLFIPVERYCNFGKFPLITMVQNMGPIVAVNGNPISERLRYIAQRYEAKIATRMATRVIVPTEFVRDFLIQQWDLPKERMSVIHYGTHPPDKEATFHKPGIIPEQWAGRFIFTAGSIEPYRGLEDLLAAFSMIKNSNIAGVVIAGEARKNMLPYYHSLKNWVVRHKLENRILWVGHLEEPEMSWCYRNSRVFAMTSRVESMSLIGLEALAHGCLCVVADNPPLPEIFGKAALYYAPRSANHLAKIIENVLGWDQKKIEQISMATRDRASTFSWDANVEQLVHEFLAVINERKDVPGGTPAISNTSV